MPDTQVTMQLAQSSEGIDLRGIIRKTGHQLEEIRLRALENILSKLRNQLICIEDLVNHRELVVNLLEWFNFDNATRVGDILALLEDLSKHGSAAATIHSLGGVEFLSTLRQDVTHKANLDKIDNILNNLFWIHTPEEPSTTDLQPTIHKDFNAFSRELDTDLSISNGLNQNDAALEESDPTVLRNTNSWTPTDQNLMKNVKEIADVEKSSDRDVEITQEHNLLTAEWVVLTSSDRHILSVTESRLQSHSPALVVQSCEFFRDVLLKDFPTHIFIQRPNIIKTLLHLLEIYTGKDDNVTAIFLDCLIEVTTNLFHNSLQQRNVDLTEIPKVNEISSSSVHTEISSLHSRATSFEGRSNSAASKNSLDKDVRSNAESEFDDYESELLTEALQQSQWTGLDFCLKIISSSCTFLMHALQRTEQCEDVILLLNRVLEVIGLFDIISMWDSSVNNRKVYDIMACLRKVTDLLQLCLETKDGFAKQSESTEDIQSIFALLADTTMISVRLINATVPISRVYEAVPENLLRCYKLIFANEILAQGYPFVRTALLGVVKIAEEEFYENYKQATEIITSMQAAKTFLEEMEKQETKWDFSSLLDLCERSLPSVGFQSYTDFIKNATLLTAGISKSKDIPASFLRRGSKILLRLISHENARVQETAYQTCLDVITDALSISHVTEPLSSSYQNARFIVNLPILKEIVCFGLESANKKIMNYCTNTIVTLLLGRLNMSPRLWQTLIECILPVLPILQGFASADKALQRALVNLSDASNALLASNGELYSLPPIEQLRASFRFMFVRDSNLRAKGFSSVVWLLTQEDSRNGSSVRYPFDSIQDASDMFIVNPSVARYSNSATGHANFVASQIDQLWEVFTSSSVDQSLRESAAEQLSILLQDPSWHKQLLEKDAKDFLIETLHSKISTIKSFSVASLETDPKMLLYCIKMLKCFALHNAVARHAMAVERNLYLDIVKARILCNNNESFHYEASSLLMLLVFDEFIKKGDAEAISVPNHVSKRYLLPYKPELYQISTEFRDKWEEKYKAYIDNLSDEPLCSMIRISWNIILAGKPEKVENIQGDYDTESSTFSSSLTLADYEARILRESLPLTSIQNYFETLRQSQSHMTAINCIRGLRKYILAFICRGSMADDAFRDVFIQLVDRIKEDNMLNRILLTTAEKNRALVLECIMSFSQLLVVANSSSSYGFSLTLMRSIMQNEGPVYEAVTSYSLQSGKKTDFTNTSDSPFDSNNEKRVLFKEILRLLLATSLTINSTNIQDRVTDVEGIGNFISILVQSLARVDSTSYYDLPVLETTLDCLYHLTFKGGWSLQFNGSGEELCNSMAHSLIQILHSFHVDRIGAATSFMGKGVMTKVALCLCHVAKESQTYCGNEDWTASWINSGDDLSEHKLDDGLPWLVPLLTDRVLDIRWAGWSLATALLGGRTGSEHVVNEFQVYPGGVWASAIGVFLDTHESPIVRSQASVLLSTLLSKLVKSGDKTAENENLWNNIIVQDTNTKANISGFPAFLLLLDHFQFFQKVKELLLHRPVALRSSSTMTALHNVSTSCSTPASGIVQRYEIIPSDSDQENYERRSSLSAYQSENQSTSNGRLPDSQCSSSKSLLLSFTDIPSESIGNGENMYRLNFNGSKPIQHHRIAHLHSSKLISSLFKLISLLMKMDAESVILRLENEGLTETITRFLDPEMITQHTSAFSDQLVHERSAIRFHENSELTKCLLMLINLIITSHEGTRDRLRSDKQFTDNILSLFKLPYTLKSVPRNVSTPLFEVWEEALRVARKLIGDVKVLEKSRMESAIIEKFHLLANAFRHTCCCSKLPFSTAKLFLVIMKSIMCREARREKDNRLLDSILDADEAQASIKKDTSKPISSNEKNWQPSDSKTSLGEYFCDALLGVSDKFQNSGTEKKEIFSSLSALFALSLSSKSFAVKRGLLESAIEDIRDIHVKLNLASLQLDRDGHDKRKEKPLLLELSELFDMLRNLVYLSRETKEAAIESGLVASIQKMWSWCLIDKTLKISVLQLLVTLTADCQKAQEVICYSGCTFKKGAMDESALFPSILKLLTKLHRDCMAPTGKIDSSTRLAFQLISNIAVLADCRGLLWKNNFYQHFACSQVGQNANKKQKVASKVLTALWIQLLLVVSFFADGAQVLLKVNGLLATLIEFASEEQHRERQKSLLILRNLLFFPANKPSLLTNSLLVNCLLKALDSKSVWSRAIVISCFASLLHNCHKAKVTLKRTKLFGKLQLTQEDLITGKLLSMDGNMQGYEQLKTAVSKTLKLLSD